MYGAFHKNNKVVHKMLIVIWALAAAGIAVLIWGLYEIVVNDMVIGG